MKILVLNCGSSSIKYALYNMDDKSVMTSGGAERVGLDGAFVKVKLANGEKKQIMHDIPEHTEGVKFIFSLLTDPEIGVIKSLDEIDAVGHRMVHGGEKFNKSVILTDEVLKTFEECSDLAPLHNPANLKGVNAVKELMPGLPQVGVFDTAFHQTMPLRVVREVWYPSLRIPRNFSPLRIGSCLRVPWCETRRRQGDYLPYW